MRLLIAEDDLASRIMLEGLARSWGYDVIAVEDGEAAWQVLQEDDPPRLLLLDWMMPRLDGLSLCFRLREQDSHDPPFVILLSARSEIDDIVRGLEAGANEYISKPISNAELHARLHVGKRMLDLQTELKQVHEKLAYQAYHDALTGLLNRGAVIEELDQEVARVARQSQSVCIGMCDIDHFKKVNDTHGHQAGDAVLQEVAQRMGLTLRPYDKVGRYGGEEFLFVLSVDPELAHIPLERLRRAIADTPFVHNDISLSITVSCGAVIFTPAEDGRGSEALIAAADSALYQAKEAGRNRTVVV